MRSRVEKLIKHLQAQIRAADHLGSDWVYITRKEAETCLELAEAEDVIMDMLGGGKC